MKKLTRCILIGIIAVTFLIAAGLVVRDRSVPMEQFLAVANGENGECTAAWYEDDQTVIAQLDSAGNILKFVSFDTLSGNQMYTIEGLAVGADGMAYALRDVKNCYDGSLLEQELLILDFTQWRGSITKTFSLMDETENYRYRFISASGETISLIATDRYESAAIRRIYEYGSLMSGTLTIKNTRTYPLREEEGIYRAIGNSTDLVYISDSGKIFWATESSVSEVYPARTVESLMYPTFIAYAESGYIYFGEHESGNIYRLELESGEETSVQSGTSPLGGASVYTSKDFLQVSMASLNSYTAVVRSSISGELQILITADGMTSVVSEIRYSFTTLLLRMLRLWGFYLIIGLGVFIVGAGLAALFRHGRTIMTRLIAVTTPVILIAMILFGMFAYNYYRSAIEENFVKQVVDEGNMLTALFGQESFNEIEYPYDYTGEAYEYLSTQLATREIYSRIIYYENSDLYIGVDAERPCFYPAGIMMNTGAEELYRQAAISGSEVTGTIQDNAGERLVCITPVGGLSGRTVYLLETGILTSNINTYMQSYIGNFAVICVSFLLIIAIILGMAFYRVLQPLGDMKWKMERYVAGETDERIEVISGDELAGISSVFNKMADDYEIQLHNYDKMSSTYYHFVPTGIMELLGKDNLEALTLGSRVEGQYVVLKAHLTLAEGIEPFRVSAVTNQFFAVINQFAMQHHVVPIVDDNNLRSVSMICESGLELALTIALASLAKADADNVFVPEEEECHISFIAHRSNVTFMICGDENRYIPVLFAPDMEELEQGLAAMNETGSRVLVTGTCGGAAELESFAYRYIGSIDRKDGSAVRIYDVYEDRPSGELKLMKQTQHTFDKAMELYEKGYYYEAKNLFTMVLHENKDDLTAKNYIFLCERLQSEK